MSETMQLCLYLMGYGLAGVFLTLALFILVIKLLMLFFPAKSENEPQ